MNDLAEFLLARIAEDEAAAMTAIDPDRPGTHWQWEAPDDAGDSDAPRWLRTTEEFPTASGVGPLPAFPLGYEFQAEPSRGMAHIARHDPARVLAECEAKRRIVQSRPGIDAFGPCLESIHAEVQRQREYVWKLLALPYAGHPAYRPEWRP